MLTIAIGRAQPRGEQLIFGMARLPNGDIMWADVDKWITAPLMRTPHISETSLVWSVDGSQLFFYQYSYEIPDLSALCVLTLQTRTHQCTTLSNDFSVPRRMVPSTDGTKVIVGVGNQEGATDLYVWEVDRSITPLAVMPFRVDNIEWAVNDVIYVSGNREDAFRINSVSLNDGAVRTILEMPRSLYVDFWSDLSPDGQALAARVPVSNTPCGAAYLYAQGGSCGALYELRVIEFNDLLQNSYEWNSLPTLNENIFEFAWSDDGDQIAYLQKDATNLTSNVFTIDLASGSVRQWTNVPAQYTGIFYSPTEAYLSYMTINPSQHNIIAVNVRPLEESSGPLTLFECLWCTGMSQAQWRPR
ncbi:MAG: hypothetical protein SF123_13435 [Chloroflexota bacterium]|nr:hypothetical protein [Chloroflexota bacterium]